MVLVSLIHLMVDDVVGLLYETLVRDHCWRGELVDARWDPVALRRSVRKRGDETGFWVHVRGGCKRVLEILCCVTVYFVIEVIV